MKRDEGGEGEGTWGVKGRGRGGEGEGTRRGEGQEALQKEGNSLQKLTAVGLK